jgi:hypothetical protein
MAEPNADRIAQLIATVAVALDELELLGVDVQMPAQVNGGGARLDSGTITFELYETGANLGLITWDGDNWIARPTP